MSTKITIALIIASIILIVRISGIVCAILTRDERMKLSKFFLHLLFWGGIIGAFIYVFKTNGRSIENQDEVESVPLKKQKVSKTSISDANWFTDDFERLESALSRKIITKEEYGELRKAILENGISIKHGIIEIGNEPFESKPFKRKNVSALMYELESLLNLEKISPSEYVWVKEKIYDTDYSEQS